MNIHLFVMISRRTGVTHLFILIIFDLTSLIKQVEQSQHFWDHKRCDRKDEMISIN